MLKVIVFCVFNFYWILYVVLNKLLGVDVVRIIRLIFLGVIFVWLRVVRDVWVVRLYNDFVVFISCCLLILVWEMIYLLEVFIIWDNCWLFRDVFGIVELFLIIEMFIFFIYLFLIIINFLVLFIIYINVDLIYNFWYF